MDQKSFSLVAGLIFALVVLFHLVRIFEEYHRRLVSAEVGKLGSPRCRWWASPSRVETRPAVASRYELASLEKSGPAIRPHSRAYLWINLRCHRDLRFCVVVLEAYFQKTNCGTSRAIAPWETGSRAHHKRIAIFEAKGFHTGNHH